MNLLNSPYVTPDDATLGLLPGKASAGTALYFMLTTVATSGWKGRTFESLRREQNRVVLDLTGCLDADIDEGWHDRL